MHMESRRAITLPRIQAQQPWLVKLQTHMAIMQYIQMYATDKPQMGMSRTCHLANHAQPLQYHLQQPKLSVAPVLHHQAPRPVHQVMLK